MSCIVIVNGVDIDNKESKKLGDKIFKVNKF